MPEISRFFGIVIYMYYLDHAPPHFHAEYGEYEITIDIGSGLVKGEFPRRALNMVLEWYTLHREELAENWRLAGEKSPLQPVAPLE
ncbi:MAG TPA: DUF4160 domain-containing protein [Gemmatimonadales bacterium]|nr:DUF4160 domain-containing protein [Gemmatimonadales bacterium]